MSQQLQEHLVRRILGLGAGDKEAIKSLTLDEVRAASGSAFSIALEKRFGDEATASEVRDFVARVRGPWIDPEALNPVLAEQLILSVYQDDHLLGNNSAADLLKTQNMLTYALVNDAGIKGEALESFIREVMELIITLADEED